jgi:hypothetical protein
MNLTFKEHSAFSAVRDELFGKETVSGSFPRLQSALMENPRAGAVIPGGNGARKVRWAAAGHAGGKRGGIRVVYHYNEEQAFILLLYAYAKNDQEDLTPRQKQQFAESIRQEPNHGE